MDDLPPIHIRLLHIEVGSGDEPMCCRLESTTLQASQAHKSISYTLGCLELELGVEQDDFRERTKQMRIMKDIFAKAFHIVIWLGKETEEHKVAFSALDRFKNLFHGRGYGGGPRHECYVDSERPEADDLSWAHLVKLFQRPWSQQIWTVQKATMVRDSSIVYGLYSTPWDFMSRVALVKNNGNQGVYPVQHLVPEVFPMTLIHVLKGAPQISQTPVLGILEILRLMRPFKATDTREKVFALMELVPDPQDIDLKVDYNISTEDVFLSVAVQSLKNRKDLSILADAGMSSTPGRLNLPSWVPNWTHNNKFRANIVVANGRDGISRSATGDSKPALSISADSKVLTIRGVQIGTIAKLETSVLFGEGVFQLDIYSVRREARWNLRCKACLDSYVAFAEYAYQFPEDQTREESLWRTLCCDLTAEIPVARASAVYAIGYKILRMVNDATQEDGQVDSSSLHFRASSMFSGQWDQFSMFMGTLGAYCRGRNLCVTDKGYLGSVPTGSLFNDTICLLFGSRVPFVLRECSEGFFRLVGECYIHGVMDGEAMTGYDLDALSQDFEII